MLENKGSSAERGLYDGMNNKKALQIRRVKNQDYIDKKSRKKVLGMANLVDAKEGDRLTKHRSFAEALSI
jgi:hypothetical protein